MYLIILSDLQLKEPLSLVIQRRLLLTLLQLLCHSPYLIRCLCCLRDVRSAREPGYDELQRVQTILQLLLVVRQFLEELLIVLVHLVLGGVNLVRDLTRPAQSIPPVYTCKYR